VQKGFFFAPDGRKIDIAVKFLLPTATEKQKLRFEREIKIMKFLSTYNLKNVMPLLDVLEFEMRDGKGIIMPYCEHKSLHDFLIHNPERFDLETACDILRELATALDFAHCNNIIHNDLKPLNIMISNDGNVLISDWGLAYVPSSSKITEVGSKPGTQGYRAPEIGNDPEARSKKTADIFSLGKIFHQLLNASSRSDPLALTLIQYMTRENPNERVQSITELLGNMSSWLHQRKTAAADRELKRIQQSQIEEQKKLEKKTKFLVITPFHCDNRWHFSSYE